MSLSPDQKLVNLTQYKELAAKVGVARYGSKTDLVSRIKGVSGGKDKLQTLIDKAKKSIVVHKSKYPPYIKLAGQWSEQGGS